MSLACFCIVIPVQCGQTAGIPVQCGQRAGIPVQCEQMVTDGGSRCIKGS